MGEKVISTSWLETVMIRGLAVGCWEIVIRNSHSGSESNEPALLTCITGSRHELLLLLGTGQWQTSLQKGVLRFRLKALVLRHSSEPQQ